MTDRLTPHAPAPDPSDIPSFTPVPVTPRRTGWTAERQRAFIEALAQMGCVSDACEAVGITPQSAYRLRRRPGAEAFDAAWERALLVGAQRLTTLAFERAVYGTIRTVRHRGEVVGEERVPSDRLLMFLLRHYDQMRYGKLSGLLPIDMPNPRAEAKAELPAVLATLVDLDGEEAEMLDHTHYQPVERAPFHDR